MFLVHAAHFRSTSTDDAYITFRYARQFATGNGMVFNPGEHVEGITNVGWALLLAPFSGGDILLASQALGAAAGVGTTLLLGAWALGLGLGVPARVAMYAAFALAPWPAWWSQQGLETAPVMFALTAGWAVLTRGYGVAGLAVAPWLRPDAALAVFVAGAWTFVRERFPADHRADHWAAGGRRTWAPWALVVGSGVALVALKLVWFGEVLPNTFHAKVGGLGSSRGWHYVANCLTAQGPVLGVLLAIAAVATLAWAVRRDARALPGLILGTWLVAIWAQGGDFMVNCRLLVPVWPAACAAIGLVVQLGGAVARVGPVLALLSAAAVSTAAWSLGKVAVTDGLDTEAPHTAQKDAPLWAPWRSSSAGAGPRDAMPFPAAWAILHVPAGATIAYSELGRFGWLHDGPVLDMLGLTDRIVAGRGGESEAERRASVRDRASWVVLGTRAPLWTAWRGELAEHGWRAVAACGQNWIFQRPDVAVVPLGGEELDRRLAAVRDRADRIGGVTLAIARELGAMGEPERAARWLETVAVSDDDRTRALCDLGLSPGCSAHPTCEAGTEPPVVSGEWPPVDPRMAAPVPTGPTVVSGPALSPATPPPAEEIRLLPPRTGACTPARLAAAERWTRAFEAERAAGAPDAARRAARVAASELRSGDGDWLASARAAHEAAAESPLVEEAWAESQAAALACGR